MGHIKGIRHEWVVVYYMSYDNNLADLGPIIMDELEWGVKGTELIVTVLSDDAELDGLKRITITADGSHKEILNTDNSAAEEVLNAYLDWVAHTYQSKHYAIIFLDHGGRLDEMCYDQWPGYEVEKHWLSAQQVGHILRQFRRDIAGEVDLVFLQQCGRASLENLYNFRNTGVVVMASEMSVGAPNTYYRSSLKWLARSDQASGLALAKHIMAHDRDFISYTCVDGDLLADLPTMLSTVAGALTNSCTPGMQLLEAGEPSFEYESETYYDVMQWFGAAYRHNRVPMEPLTTFRSWLCQRLRLAHRVNPSYRTHVRATCGFSLFVPRSLDVLKPYVDYPIYRDSRLIEVWDRCFQEANAEQGRST